MGKVTGFMEYERIEEGYKPVTKRVKHYKEFVVGLTDDEAKVQGARCMDCGTPFCNSGCPVNNIIPDFNDLVYRDGLAERLRGAGLDQQLPRVHRPHLPRAVRGGLRAERQRRPGRHQVDRARDHRPRLGRGLGRAAAARSQDRQEGRRRRLRPGRPGRGAAAGARRPRRDAVREERPHRRPAALRHPRLQDGEVAHRPPRRADEGRGRHLPHRRAWSARRPQRGSKVTNWAKETIAPSSCKRSSTPCCSPAAPSSSRDLPVPGRDLDGVHFAMEFLPQQNKINAGDKVKGQIRADGKHVIVIGGGDTGSDCVGTSNRHGAKSVTQFELMPQPPEEENKPLTWPYWPTKLRTSSSHEEGCEREFAIATKEFIGEKGKLTGLKTVRVEWKDGKMVEVAGTRAGAQGRPRAAGDGLRQPGREPAGRPSASRRTRAATPRRATDVGRRLRDQRAEGVRRRRHAPRPVAGGLGDPRRPPGGARGGRIPDGLLATCRADATTTADATPRLTYHGGREPGFPRAGCPTAFPPMTTTPDLLVESSTSSSATTRSRTILNDVSLHRSAAAR